MYGGESRGIRRAHSPDTSDNNSFRGSFRGHHSGPPFNKRHRGIDYNQHLSIDDKIVRLGETGSRNVDIGLLSKEIDADLTNKTDEEEKIKNLAARICRCIISFPTRTATYATLIGLISVKHYNISCQVINTLYSSYPVYLEAQKWKEALTIMHLLASLVNCKVIRPSALISQFDALLEAASEENSPQTRSDYYVYTVLSSLPFVALELSTDQEPFEKLLSKIESYLSQRSKDHLNFTRVWLSSDSTTQMDYIDSLWVQLKNFRANNWYEIFMHRPYNDKEYKDIMASSLIPQNSPTVQVPAHSYENVYPPPRIVFRIFEDDVVEGHKAIPGSDKIERFCIENHIRNLMDELHTDVRDCARHLVSMNRADHLPMKHILIETVLGELFALPRPKYHEIFYHSLMNEFNKMFQVSLNQSELKFNYDFILNEAVKVLYENLESMNVTCLDRFTKWFSFHLTNISYLFPWEILSDAVTKGETSQKRLFVKHLLHHSCRLNFDQKLNTLIGEPLNSLLPPQRCTEYKPININHPEAQSLATTIQQIIQFKADPPTICQNLNIMIDGAKLPDDFELKEEKYNDKLMKIDIFLAVILTIASKSITHVSSAIGKYKDVINAILKVEGGQIQLLETLNSCLKNDEQLQIILVDKFLKAKFVDANSICEWVFSPSVMADYNHSYLWEILNNAISRSILDIEKFTKGEVEVVEVAKLGQDEDVDMKAEERADVDIKKEEIERQEKAEAARTLAKNLVLEVFRMFANLLGDHIRKCEVSGRSYMDDWFRLITGRMQQVYYLHYDAVCDQIDEIRNIIDAIPSIGNSIFNFSV